METPLLHIQGAPFLHIQGIPFLHIQGTVHSLFHPTAEHVCSLVSTTTFSFQRGCTILMNVAVPKRTVIFFLKYSSPRNGMSYYLRSKSISKKYFYLQCPQYIITLNYFEGYRQKNFKTSVLSFNQQIPGVS